MAKELVAADTGTSQDLVLDPRHTLVRAVPGESDQANRTSRWLVFRAPVVSGSGPVTRDGGVPELWFELQGRRIDCPLRDAAGWQERNGAAVALYEAPLGGESGGLAKGGLDSAWGLRWGSDELRGALGPDTIELLVGRRSGRG